MIKLNLCIGKGDCKEIPFYKQQELRSFLQELDRFDCIWLATDNGEKGEILITESLKTLIISFDSNLFNTLGNDGYLFIQEYQTYEDAYAVALSMREPNPRCYNE